jgi:competence protein ComEC
LPRYPEFEYGDTLQIRGELAAPVEFDGFDYAGYLSRQNVYSVMYYPEAECLSKGNGNALLSLISDLRNQLEDSLSRTLPEPQASLAQGILLGLRANIPSDISGDFTRSGMMHLLAISGLNLTLISGLLISLLIRLLGRRHYIYVWVAGGAIWFYVLLCGASPSVVRAGAMATVFLAAELAGRQKNGGPALFFAGAVMALFNPGVLRDVSFQLSFLAMFGLIYICPFLRRLVKRLTEHIPEQMFRHGLLYVIDNLLVSLGAMLAILPVLAVNFGSLSLAGPVATVLASPLLPLIIVFSLAVAAAGLVLPSLALAVGSILWLFTTCLSLIAGIFSYFPVLDVERFNILIVPVYYVLMMIALWWLMLLKRRRLVEEFSQL